MSVNYDGWSFDTLLSIFSAKFDMRHRRWLKLLKDYDITILYRLGKSNTVANALSRKAPIMVT